MWKITESKYDEPKELMDFHLVNTETGQSERCGITRIAINDHFKTEDSRDKAKQNFEENEGFVVGWALALIAAGEVDNDGRYLILGKNINP